ncbi:hypothetical protein NDU88_011592 [Pleurodeles waltl]|uniref:Uncharacterized protein n=1 Tax=Pleurodeles waltl TaxID=8319 RepID=A0AAV7S5B1_PLEWA|nr:hypothetical protein NDU88_011592 [Pleurodeles waltl]
MEVTGSEIFGSVEDYLAIAQSDRPAAQKRVRALAGLDTAGSEKKESGDWSQPLMVDNAKQGVDAYTQTFYNGLGPAGRGLCQKALIMGSWGKNLSEYRQKLDELA